MNSWFAPFAEDVGTIVTLPRPGAKRFETVAVSQILSTLGPELFPDFGEGEPRTIVFDGQLRLGIRKSVMNFAQRLLARLIVPIFYCDFRFAMLMNQFIQSSDEPDGCGRMQN